MDLKCMNKKNELINSLFISFSKPDFSKIKKFTSLKKMNFSKANQQTKTIQQETAENELLT